MSKYPNGGKVTTKNSESCKANETNLPCEEGISQIYLSSELVIHEAVHDGNVFHLYASSSLGHGICQCVAVEHGYQNGIQPQKASCLRIAVKPLTQDF